MHMQLVFHFSSLHIVLINSGHIKSAQRSFSLSRPALGVYWCCFAKRTSNHAVENWVSHDAKQVSPRILNAAAYERNAAAMWESVSVGNLNT